MSHVVNLNFTVTVLKLTFMILESPITDDDDQQLFPSNEKARLVAVAARVAGVTN